MRPIYLFAALLTAPAMVAAAALAGAIGDTPSAIAVAPIMSPLPPLPTVEVIAEIDLSPTARRGAEYREIFGIEWVSFAWTEQPESRPDRRVHRTTAVVHFADGRVLTNPSVINGDMVDNSEQFSETDDGIYRSIRAYNNESVE